MSATATSALVPEILNEYGELTRAKLREYLPIASRAVISTTWSLTIRCAAEK